LKSNRRGEKRVGPAPSRKRDPTPWEKREGISRKGSLKRKVVSFQRGKVSSQKKNEARMYSGRVRHSRKKVVRRDFTTTTAIGGKERVGLLRRERLGGTS